MSDTRESKYNVSQLKEMIIDVQNESELKINKFTLCSKIIGFGQYIPVNRKYAKAGTELLFYYEPVNLFTNRLNGAYQVWFGQDMEVLNSDRELIFKQENILNFNYQTITPVLDIFGTNNLALDKVIDGAYIFRIRVHDKLKDTSVEAEFPFNVVS